DRQASVRPGQARRARARQQIAAGIGRMADADVAEGVQHAFVRQHAVGERNLVAGVEKVGHEGVPHWAAQRRRSDRSQAAIAPVATPRPARDALPSGNEASRVGSSRAGTGEQHMSPVVAVSAPGMMGAAVAGRLVENGVKVITSLAGRSPETVARAARHGLTSAGEEEIAAADFILSIVPPGEAVALAQRFAPALTASNSKPVYVDCNAVSPATAERIAAAIAPTGSPFLDARIIGSPPPPRGAGPPLHPSRPPPPPLPTL